MRVILYDAVKIKKHINVTFTYVKHIYMQLNHFTFCSLDIIFFKISENMLCGAFIYTKIFLRKDTNNVNIKPQIFHYKSCMECLSKSFANICIE